MRYWIIGFMALVISAVSAPAQTEDKQGIEQTIQGQLDAFRADDFAGAFEYASPMIQGMFGSADRFGMMVQRGYPMVWRNQTVRYLELREISGQLWQRVMVQDASGTLHMLDYQMIPVQDGWQINGVQLLPAPDIGA